MSFNINQDYFEGNGVFVCDRQDYIIDFKYLNDYIWNYILEHPKCEFIEDCKVIDIKT